MKSSRILALVLALMMVISLAPTALADDEPVKISVASYMFGPIDNSLDVITPLVEQQLKEKHGINVDIEVVYIEQANYGEILGTRQHGLPDMRLADMAKHMNVLNDARDEAKAILEDDPKLQKPQNQPLKRRVVKLMGKDMSLNL